MPDDPKDTIEFAIRSAFISYPKEDDPDWKPALDHREGMRIFGDGHHTGIASQGISDREEIVLTPRGKRKGRAWIVALQIARFRH